MKEGHEIFCDFIINSEKIEDEIFGKAIKILIEVFQDSNLSDDDTNKKIKNIFKNKIEYKKAIEKEYNNIKNMNENDENLSKIVNLLK